MPTVMIPDTIYANLARKATAQGMTVLQYIEPELIRLVKADQAASDPSTLSREEWKKKFDEYHAWAATVTQHLPPGYRADDDREAFYRDDRELQ